jgi:predicted ATPase
MLKNFLRPKPVEKKRKVVVVSGLPRSGTSMMMKMLSEGGMPIVTDSQREADEDNPNGYFEIELSKKLKDGEINWIYAAQGKAVKVISYLLEFLPNDLEYDIVFMDREIDEVLASQKKMLARRNETSSISDEEMDAQFRAHLKAAKYWLARQPNMRVLYIKYNEAVDSPESICPLIAGFLGQPLKIEAMQSVPSQSLHRNRARS